MVRLYNYKPIKLFLWLILFYSYSGFSQSYFNRIVGVDIGYSLPLGLYGSKSDNPNSGFAQSSLLVGVHVGLPLYKKFKYNTSLFYTKHDYDINAAEQITEEGFNQTIIAGATMKFEPTQYHHVLWTHSGSWHFDLTGRKKWFGIPHAGMFFQYTQLNDLKSVLGFSGTSFSTQELRFDDVTSIGLTFGLDLRYMLHARWSAQLSTNYYQSTILFSNYIIETTDLISNNTEFYYESLAQRFQVLHLQAGFNFHF